MHSSSKQTILKHGEVRVVHGEQVEVRREPGHQPDESIIDLLIRATVPPGQHASLGWCQKELEIRKKTLRAKTHKSII